MMLHTFLWSSNKFNVGICSFFHCNVWLYNVVWEGKYPMCIIYVVVRYVYFIGMYQLTSCSAMSYFLGFVRSVCPFEPLYCFLSVFHSPTWDSECPFMSCIWLECKAKTCIHTLAVASGLCYCLSSLYICLVKWRETPLGIKVD